MMDCAFQTNPGDGRSDPDGGRKNAAGSHENAAGSPKIACGSRKDAAGRNTGGRILVSVIIPAWGAQEYLCQAVNSALKQTAVSPKAKQTAVSPKAKQMALTQTAAQTADLLPYGSVEILIIDDCSPDQTGEVAERLREAHPDLIRVFHNAEDIGVAETRNVGIRSARGKYIAFLDADDWWAEGKLSAQVGLLEETGAVLCATGRELMHPDGASTGRIIGVPASISYENLLRGNVIPCSSVLMRTAAAQEFGMCRDDLHEDYILWLRVLRAHGDAVGIDRPYLKSRLSAGGKSRDKKKSAKMTWGVYRYLGFGPLRSLYYFIHYAWNGIRKYYG